MTFTARDLRYLDLEPAVLLAWAQRCLDAARAETDTGLSARPGMVFHCLAESEAALTRARSWRGGSQEVAADPETLAGGGETLTFSREGHLWSTAIHAAEAIAWHRSVRGDHAIRRQIERDQWADLTRNLAAMRGD